MNDWKVKLEKETIFFITPDIKRGLGLEGILPNFHLICSYSDPLIEPLKENGTNVFCLEGIIGEDARNINNSGKLLQNSHVLNYIRQHAKGTPYIAFFKPSVKLDILIKDLGFLAMGNSADKNEMFENKVNLNRAMQGIIPDYQIPSVTGKMEFLDYSDIKNKIGGELVVQFGHGWAGKTTFFVFRKEDFIKLQKKFGQTIVRVSKYIEGITLLNNCCIYQENIFVSPPALQISGLPELCDNPSVTCGRQWPNGFLSTSQTEKVGFISRELGKVMQKSGYRGIFGIDFLIEYKTGKNLFIGNKRQNDCIHFLLHKNRNGNGDYPINGLPFCRFYDKRYTGKVIIRQYG
jgi:hypothetical protein